MWMIKNEGKKNKYILTKPHCLRLKQHLQKKKKQDNDRFILFIIIKSRKTK